MLVLYNNHVWHWNKNFFYFILFFILSIIFSPLKGRYWYRNKCLADLLQQWICKPFCIWVFLEFYWKADVNWLFLIIKGYVKVNFKEIIIIIIIITIIIIIIAIAHSDMLYRLDISTFCFYEPLLFQIFVSWKFIKT